MNRICGFCDKPLELIEHANKELFDLLVCEDCQLPKHNTRYRQLYFKDGIELLAETVRFEEYYIVLNHSFNYTSAKTNYTTIYRKVIGAITQSIDLQPITWDSDLPVCTLDSIIKLPLKNPELLKRKLQIYTLFS